MTEEIVALLHLALIILVVAYDAAGVGVGLVFGESVERLAESPLYIGVVGIDLLQQVAVIKAFYIIGIDYILAHALEACQCLNLLEFGLGDSHKAAASFGVADDVGCGYASFEDVGVGT